MASDNTPSIKTDYKLPSTYLYSKGHVWAAVDDLHATIGMTDFIFDLVLREYFFLQLPSLGEEVKRGQLIGAVDALKVAIPILAPLSGMVSEVNGDVLDDFSVPMRSPYTLGWLVKMDLSEPIELKQLMRQSDYLAFLATRKSLDFTRQSGSS